MKILVKAITYQALWLGSGILGAALTGIDALFTFGYMFSFIFALVAVIDDGRGENYLLSAFLIFLVWLGAVPVFYCIVYCGMTGFIGRSPPPQCGDALSCSLSFIHYKFGTDIESFNWLKFLEDADDIPDMIVNAVPYLVAQGVVWLFGVNWWSITGNLLFMFIFHFVVSAIAVAQWTGPRNTL